VTRKATKQLPNRAAPIPNEQPPPLDFCAIDDRAWNELLAELRELPPFDFHGLEPTPLDLPESDLELLFVELTTDASDLEV
jgi:hypothetical protein